MPTPRRVHARALGALALLAAGCGDSPSELDEPTGPPGLRIVSAEAITDTVLAQPSQALVVEVRDERGVPLRRVEVRFEAFMSVPPNANPYVATVVSRVTGLSYWPRISDTTDDRGRARALVALGQMAGPAGVVVSVPEIGAEDTLQITITPGAAARVRSLPADTAVIVGRSFTMRGVVTDRFGNPRTDPVTYSAGSAAMTVSGSTVTGQAIARERVIATAGGLADTSVVSVVPDATLAATTSDALITFKTDGSARTNVATIVSGGGTTDWSPDGSQIAFDGGSGQQFVATVATGAVRTASTMGVSGRWSPDGATLYYSRVLWGLRRQNRDGTGDAAVTMTSPGRDACASPSPDGTRLVFHVEHIPISGIEVLTLATGASAALNVSGESPNWSPSGTEIAFVGMPGGELRLMSADGTNVRTLSAGGRYGRGMDWSSDGRWLVAYNATTLTTEIIDSRSGLVLPLAFTRGWTAPSWRP